MNIEEFKDAYNVQLDGYNDEEIKYLYELTIKYDFPIEVSKQMMIEHIARGNNIFI